MFLLTEYIHSYRLYYVFGSSSVARPRSKTCITSAISFLSNRTVPRIAVLLGRGVGCRDYGLNSKDIS